MQITVKYFGSLVEKTGVKEEIIDTETNCSDLQELKAFCFKKYGIVESSSIQLAVNQNLQKDGKLKNGDEVVFLPPFSGG